MDLITRSRFTRAIGLLVTIGLAFVCYTLDAMLASSAEQFVQYGTQPLPAGSLLTALWRAIARHCTNPADVSLTAHDFLAAGIWLQWLLNALVYVFCTKNLAEKRPGFRRLLWSILMTSHFLVAVSVPASVDTLLSGPPSPLRETDRRFGD